MIFLAAGISAYGQVYMPSPNTNTNNNNDVGINQQAPQARLHISDDAAQLNCEPAILIDTYIGDGASQPPGPESTTCSTPYAMRVYSHSNNSQTYTFNLAGAGILKLGTGIENITTNTTLNVMKHFGLYQDNGNYLKLYQEAGFNPGVLWNNNATGEGAGEFHFRFGNSMTTGAKVFSISPQGQAAVGNIPIYPDFDFSIPSGLLVQAGRIGFGTENPETILHIKDLTPGAEINDETNPPGGVYGLLIENEGWRNHDYALEIRSYHGKLFTVGNAGTVHIGYDLNWAIPDGDFKLYVQDGIRAERVRVDVAAQNGWADYVFEEGYELMPIEELKAYINEHKHLPGVPSAAEVVEKGIDLAEMNKILLEKIEQQALMIIQLNNRLNKVEER